MSQEKVGEPVMFESPPCIVTVEAGLTINLGNYQSAKVGVTISVPCAHGEIEDVFEFGKGWVDDKMSLMAAQVEAAKK